VSDNRNGASHAVEALTSRTGVYILSRELEDAAVGEGAFNQWDINVQHALSESSILYPHYAYVVLLHEVSGVQKEFTDAAVEVVSS